MFELGDTVALKHQHRNCLPYELHMQEFFKLTTLDVPPHCHYVAKHSEPLWAAIQPCDSDGSTAPSDSPVRRL